MAKKLITGLTFAGITLLSSIPAWAGGASGVELIKNLKPATAQTMQLEKEQKQSIVVPFKAKKGEDAHSVFSRYPQIAQTIDEVRGNKDKNLCIQESEAFAESNNPFAARVTKNYPSVDPNIFKYDPNTGEIGVIPGAHLTKKTKQPQPQKPTIPSRYSNLKGVDYALVLPKVNGSYWPVLIDVKDGQPHTRDILGYEETGNLRISQFEYPVTEKGLVLGILEKALTKENVEERTLSNHVLSYALAKKTGAKKSSQLVRESNLEKVLAQESCFGNEGCTTYTKEEIAIAASNLAVYERSAQIIADKLAENGIDIENIEEFRQFAEPTRLEEYSKTLFGYALPINTAIGLHLDWTGSKPNEGFKKATMNIIEEKTKNLQNPKQIFQEVHSATTDVFNALYAGGQK